MKNLLLAAGLGLVALAGWQMVGRGHDAGVSAPTSTVHAAAADEAAPLISACGSTVADSDRTPPDAVKAQGLDQRTVVYPQVDFVFMRAHGDGWQLTGAFRPKHNDALSKDAVEKLMPCVAKVSFANDLF